MKELEKRIAHLWLNDDMLYAFKLSEQLPEESLVRQIIEERINVVGGWDIDGKGYITNAVPINVSDFQKFALAIELIKNLGLEEPKVLDVGCYNGYFLKELIKEVYCEAHGADIFEMEGAYEPGVFLHEIRAMDLYKHFPSQFDVVTCFDALEHMFYDKAAIESMEKVAKEGATIIMNLPQPKNDVYEDYMKALKEIQPEHLRPYTKEYVKELFGHKDNLKFYDCKDENGNPTWFLTYTTGSSSGRTVAFETTN